jgi:Na+/H+ antiporter NhaD/arsenite permease-like protein
VSPLLLSTLIFVGTYVLIASERLHRTLAALLGAVILLLLHLLSQEEAFLAVDFNVIFLLAGMMIIAGVLQKTGVFQWTALRAAKVARGHPAVLLVLLSLVTAVLSAFLDNVTTVVLTVPLTIFITGVLRLNPVPYLIAQVLASNIGGAATLIGDPPNIMVGSRAGLDFVDFLVHVAPIAIIILIFFCFGLGIFFWRRLHVEPALREALLRIEERELITDHRLLRVALFVLGLTILGFLLHGALHYEAATVALAGAVLLVILARQQVHEVLKEVEWASLFFFIGLFIVVEGVVKAGLIELLADRILAFTGGDLRGTTLLLLWMSAIASGIVDNIPYTATMLPLVEQLGETIPEFPLWLALILGADMGGNLTLIAASANVIVAGLAEENGYPIRFWEFLKYGVVVTFASVFLCTIYLWVRYL